MQRRTLDELIDLVEPGMALVREWINAARNPTCVLEGDAETGRRSLLELQITSRSLMGALALETGGVLIDGGWIRVYGSGHPRLPRGIDTWNRLSTPEALRQPGALVVGDDALGGFFAVNAGGLAGEVGGVHYFGPDTLRWEPLWDAYSEWLSWTMNADFDAFYAGTRWPGWREDLLELSPEHGFSIYPPLWAAGPPIGSRSRRGVPVEELWQLHVVEWPGQLGP